MPRVAKPKKILSQTCFGIYEIIEHIQYRAALAITGAWKGTSHAKVYEELAWESLSDRRRSRLIRQIHKIATPKKKT